MLIESLKVLKVFSFQIEFNTFHHFYRQNYRFWNVTTVFPFFWVYLLINGFISRHQRIVSSVCIRYQIHEIARRFPAVSLDNGRCSLRYSSYSANEHNTLRRTLWSHILSVMMYGSTVAIGLALRADVRTGHMAAWLWSGVLPEVLIRQRCAGHNFACRVTGAGPITDWAVNYRGWWHIDK